MLEKVQVYTDEIFTSDKANEEKKEERPDFRKDANIRMFDTVLMLNVIEGELTQQNYNKVMCSFLNKSLGNMYRQLKHRTKNYSIDNDKLYFSLKEELKKLETQSKENEKLNHSTQKNIVKGGRKTKHLRSFKKM